MQHFHPLSNIDSAENNGERLRRNRGDRRALDAQGRMHDEDDVKHGVEDHPAAQKHERSGGIAHRAHGKHIVVIQKSENAARENYLQIRIRGRDRLGGRS